MPTDRDSLYRFVFEHSRVRGELVRLDAAWQAVLERHPYPDAIKQPLGEALATVALLTATLKLKGSLILQIQSEGPIRTLVAQATHDLMIRGLARWNDEVAPGNLQDLFGGGRLVITIAPDDQDRYQGIVPLEGTTLGAAIERYFASSEQLPTRFWLAVDEHRAAGLMLQRLPGKPADDDDWNRATILADTVQRSELLQRPAPDLLRRLFHEETVRLYEPEPIAFRCSCSRDRIADNLRTLGRDEIDSILAEQGAVEVTCEFCNRDYHFDSVDAAGLFAGVVSTPASSAQH